MAKTLISSFIGTPLPSLPGNIFHRRRQLISTRVKFSFHELPPIQSLHSSFDFDAVVSRAEGLIYTLADAAVAADPTAVASDATAAQKTGGWFGFISDAMEVVLKVMKDGLQTVHVPYAYGFAIILLTLLVKAVTFPLTKQQVESTLAMQNLQPKIKAIQQRYAGNQERIQLETSRLYKQAGVNPLADVVLSLDRNKRAEAMKKLHEKVRLHLEKKNQETARRANKGRKRVVLEPGDWVWVHFRKERFSNKRKTRLMPREDGLFEVLERLNDNAYKIYLPPEYQVHNTFNVCDLSSMDLDDGDRLNLRTNSFQEGENDTTQVA